MRANFGPAPPRPQSRIYLKDGVMRDGPASWRGKSAAYFFRRGDLYPGCRVNAGGSNWRAQSVPGPPYTNPHVDGDFYCVSFIHHRNGPATAMPRLFGRPRPAMDFSPI